MQRADAVRLRVKVVPGAAEDAVAGWLGERLKLRVRANPEKGKANAAVEKLLATALGLPDRAIRVVAGHAASDKTVAIEGLDEDRLHERLSPDVRWAANLSTMQRALLLVAHGSRREASNEEIRQITERLRAEAASSRFSAVDCAFLELAEPSIPDGIERLIAQGAEAVTVLPYFLAAGRHVIEDIPELVDAKRSEHPGVEIELAPYLGTADAIPGLLLSLVR